MARYAATACCPREVMDEDRMARWLGDLVSESRIAFSTHLMEDGTDIRTLQELLGHADGKATKIDTHVARGTNGKGLRSPLDACRERGVEWKVKSKK